MTHALEVMASPVAAAILHDLYSHPGSTARDLTNRLEVGGKHIVHYHLNRLAADGLITRTGAIGRYGYAWTRDETALLAAVTMIAAYLHVDPTT